MLRRLNIYNRLALVLWGAAACAFIVAGAGLLLYQSLTIEHRAWQIMEPYAQLVSVGADAAVAFEDTQRAQEILNTLKANPQIIEADIFLAGGRVLAGFSRQPGAKPRSLPAKPDGVYLGHDSAELLQRLPQNARLRISMGLEQLSAQTHQALWMFGIGMLALLAVTLSQLAVLRRMIVRPIASLTEATERVRARADYQHRIPASGTDEVSRLGQSFNDMLEEIQQREDDLHRLTRFQRTILDNVAYAIVSTTPDGVVTSFNPAAERLLGYAAGEVIGKQTPALWHDAEEIAQRAKQLSAELGEAIAPGFEVFAARPRRNLPEEAEWTFTRRDGQRFPVNLSVTAMRDDRGHITGFVGLTYDLTERKHAETAMHRLNRELRAITDCNQVLVRAEDEQSLLDDVCRIVCEEAGYRMAWVGYAEHDEARTLRPVAWAESGYLGQSRLAWAGKEWKLSLSGRTVRSGEISVIDDFANDAQGAAPWRDAALRRGYRSCISLPLKDESANTFGVLGIYSAEANAFTAEEQRLMAELAGDLAFGIVALRTRAERNAAEEQVRIAATAFEAQEGIIITDANQVILKVNRAFTEITGYRPEEVVGKTPSVLRSGRQDEAFYREMWQHIREAGSWQGELWNRRKNGEVYPEWANITAVKNPRGEVTHYVGNLSDITERKAAERKIAHLAYYDILTELPNRRLLIDRLQQAMAGSARNRRVGALLFIDLDNFKLINDTCGHDVGDRLLIEVASRLSACVRDGDTISRLGGDEFVVMLEDLSESPAEAAAQAKAVGEQIMSALDRPYDVAGRVHHSTPSIGATLFVDSENSVEELLKQADIAMYQAKAAGRNTLRFYDPDMQAAVAARAELEAALRIGILEHQFVLHYQPQVEGAHSIVGAEVLLRWQRSERSRVSPDQFIPLAEEIGLILPIGQWVLEEACTQLASWSQDPHSRDLRLAVNVSARQFRQDDFVDRVRHALEASRAPATRLKLELTESMVIADVEDTIEKMRALKGLGVSFSMDDFGTGYSSLSYLTQLPLDQVKIDQSFVRNLPDSASDAAVAQTIITLAKGLGLAVIAEGVETEAQRQFLDQHGCPTFQGHLFSKAVTLATFEELLAQS
jgi:diguanylate cyclase (GGDEF)-like protein/PAS domain S-box-containing protein